MLACPHPEVLSNEWLPPIAIGREPEVAEVVRRLDPPRPRAPPPWWVAVVGPSGAGTSTVARRAARETADRVRGGLSGPPPRVLPIRVGDVRGTHGVATAMLRKLDDGFDGRGFAVTEILAGVLRRVRREGRPVVLVFDDVAVGGADLAPILLALGNPDRFLPEGEVGLPPIWGILAGGEEPVATQARAVADRVPIGPFVRLAPYSRERLREIAADRLARSLGRSAPEPMVGRVLGRCLEDGGGARRVVDLIRREIAGGDRRPRVGPFFGVPRPVPVEPHVVRAIGAVAQGCTAGVGDVRRAEAELARSAGVRPLPTTTLWRRIVRLEQAGYVRREIRTGGTGGTRSIVRVLTPIDEWVTAPYRPETPRASVAPDGASRLPEGPARAGAGSGFLGA